MSRFRGMKFFSLAAALLLAGAVGAAPKVVSHGLVQGGAGDFTLKGFQMNPQCLVDLYNSAQQNGGNITQLPSSWQQFNSVVQLELTNNESIPDTPYIQIRISYQNCASVVSGALNILTTRAAINPGTTSLGAGAFTVYDNSFSGTQVSSCFQSIIKNDFSNISNMQQAVQAAMTASFNVCLQLYTSSSNGETPYGAPVCSVFQILTPQSAIAFHGPVYVSPYKGEILCGTAPLFMWSATTGPNTSPSTVAYSLQVTQDEANGVPVASIQIPAGQTYYQWKAKDPVLQTGVKYYYCVQSLNNVGQPIFSSSSSATVWSNFTIQCGAGSAVTMEQVDTVARKAIGGNSGLKAIAGKMASMKLESLISPARLNDPIYQQLVNGTASVTSVEVETH